MSEAQYDHSEAGQGDSPRRQADDHASDDADEYSPRGGGATQEGRATPGQHYDGPASDSSPARRRVSTRTTQIGVQVEPRPLKGAPL